jgi:phage gp29-like protein
MNMAVDNTNIDDGKKLQQLEQVNTTPDTSTKPYVQEVATSAKDIDVFTGYFTRQENPDKVIKLEGRGRGTEIYEDLDRDPQVYSMLQTRALALQSCEWQIIPADENNPQDVKEAEFVEKVLKFANFDRLTRDSCHAILCGYKPIEIMWDISEGDIWINEFRGRRPSRFSFDMAGGMRLLTIHNSFYGDPIPDRKFLSWTFGGNNYTPFGQGVGREVFWPVWFKKNGIKFWLTYCEQFGSPTKIAKYPPGTSKEDRNTLLDAISATEQETGIIIPNTMAVEYLEAMRSGQNSTYENEVEFMDRYIAKVMLGQTLTSEPHATGSLALGQIHDQIRHDILKADADDMCEYFNRTLVRWLIDYNFPSKGRNRLNYPKVWRRTDPEKDLIKLAQRDKIIIVDMGMGPRIPEAYITDTYGIQLAEPGEPTIHPPAPKAPGAFSEFAEGSAAINQGHRAVDDIITKSLPKAANEIEVLLKPVMKFIENAKSLDEIGKELFKFYPKLDRTRFQKLLTRAIFASSLTGYESAAKESK